MLEQLKNNVLCLKNDEKFNCLVKDRIKQFENIGKGSCDKIFKELCFCLMTANFNAARSILIQKNIDDGFLISSEEQLTEQLKKYGHRFPAARAKYIIEARQMKNLVCQKMKVLDEYCFREWIVDNIKGLGFKESSHFLRNIGYKNSAIIDFHIVDILERCDVIQRPKTMTKKKYLEIECELKKMADSLDMSLSELDLYLWYIETGKLLK